jgi:hypothetical protein
MNRSRTLSTTVNIHRAMEVPKSREQKGIERIPKPIVSDEFALDLTVRDVSPSISINVPFRKAKVNHVDSFVIWRQSNHTVP